MTELRTSKDHRLLQVFLSGNGIFEVYIHARTKAWACTCPGFNARSQCKHVTFVQTRYIERGNSYPVALKQGAEPQNIEMLSDHDAFRNWVIANARVEVLD